jgi:hypothetical protein
MWYFLLKNPYFRWFRLYVLGPELIFRASERLLYRQYVENERNLLKL